MIQYYNTEAEYAAAAKPAGESQVSRVIENNAIHYDGKNVVVGLRSAKTGDAAVLDPYNTLRFIPWQDFTGVPSGFTFIGAVGVGVDHPMFRGKVLIVDKTQDSKIMSYYYSFRLTGYTLDGTDRTGVLSIRTAAAWNTAVDFTVAYNATTVSSLVSQLNAFFRDTTNEVFQTQDWIAVENGGAIDLQFHLTAYQQASNTGKTGFTLTANLLPGIVATSAMYRRNGQRTGEGTVFNMDRALAYFRADLNNATYNPTTTQTAANAKRSYPICLPGYLGTSQYSGGADRCEAIRAIYGEGEAGWLKFMESFLPVWPTAYGSIGNKKTYGDGMKNTYIMAGKTWTGQDGVSHQAHPAADFVTAPGYNHELLKKGCWAGPDSEMLAAIMKTIKYNTTNNRNADPINQTMYKGGGAAVSNGSVTWSFSRFSASIFWYFNGTNGCAYYNHVHYSNRCLPVVLLDVNEVNG